MVVRRLMFGFMLFAIAIRPAMAEGEDWTCAEAKNNLDNVKQLCKKNNGLACEDEKEALEIYNNRCNPHTIVDRLKAVRPVAPSKIETTIKTNSNQGDP